MLIQAHKMPTMAAINARSKKAKLNAVSFFSGMGGASIGLKMSGYDVRYANEFIFAAADAYDLNSGGLKCDRYDIRKVTAKRVLQMSGLKAGEIDLMEGSPPCKLFTKVKAQDKGEQFKKDGGVYSEGVKQDVADLFFEFCRILKVLQPKVFITENVSGLLQNMNRHYFLSITEALEACGYVVETALLDASRYGTPQKRERVVLQGIRKDLYKKGVRHAWPKMHPTTTVKDCLPHISKVFVSKRGYKDADIPSPTVLAVDHTTTEYARYSSGGWVEDDKGVRRKWTIPELKVVSGVPVDFKFPKYEDEKPRKRFQRAWERMGRIHGPIQVYYLGKAIREQIFEKHADILKGI